MATAYVSKIIANKEIIKYNKQKLDYKNTNKCRNYKILNRSTKKFTQ